MSNENTKMSAWIDLAQGLYTFLNERNTTIHYSFENLNVSVPQTTGDSSPTAKWSLNGAVSISTSEKMDSSGRND